MDHLHNCGICLDDDITVNNMKTMLCGHMICSNCYDKLTVNTCPFCRVEYKHKLFMESRMFQHIFMNTMADIWVAAEKVRPNEVPLKWRRILDKGDKCTDFINEIVDFDNESISEDYLEDINLLYDTTYDSAKKIEKKIHANITERVRKCRRSRVHDINHLEGHLGHHDNSFSGIGRHIRLRFLQRAMRRR